MDNRYRRVAEEQDAIGWRKFMEGMICRGLRHLQELYTTVEGSNVTGKQWATGVITKLLETTHGQWLYRCVQVHDRFSGIQATLHPIINVVCWLVDLSSDFFYGGSSHGR